MSTDESGSPIVCSYAWVDNYEAGRIGLVTNKTLNPHPRLHMLAALDSRVNGAEGAPAIVSENSIAYQALVRRYTTSYPALGTVFDADCDGITPARCPKAEAAMVQGALANGDGLMNVALLWYANQSTHPEYLTTVKYWLNHIERAVQSVGTAGPMNYAVPYEHLWAKGPQTDWVSLTMHGAAVAYSIVRSQMTTAERTAFANKMLNGVETNTTCVWNSPVATGLTATWAANRSSMTASGDLTGLLNPGDWVFAANSLSWDDQSGTWGRVSSVSGTTATFDLPPTNAITGKPLFTAPGDPIAYQDWSGNQCGLAALVNMHVSAVPYANHWELIMAGSALPKTGVNPGDTASLTISDASGMALTAPFYGVTKFGEVLYFASNVNNVFTVTRGALYSTIQATTSGDTIRAVRWINAASLQPPFNITGQWQDNLVLNRQQGYIAAGLALADDDPRAAQLGQDALNYYHDYTYFDLARHMTIRSPGGNSIGYQMGRWGDMAPTIASMFNSAANVNIWERFDRRYIYEPIYISWPGTPQSGPGRSRGTISARASGS